MSVGRQDSSPPRDQSRTLAAAHRALEPFALAAGVGDWPMPHAQLLALPVETHLRPWHFARAASAYEAMGGQLAIHGFRGPGEALWWPRGGDSVQAGPFRLSIHALPLDLGWAWRVDAEEGRIVAQGRERWADRAVRAAERAFERIFTAEPAPADVGVS